MARGRMINTTIALDPEFNGLSIEAQLMFLRTVPHLDRDGLIIGQPTALWATVALLMPDLMTDMQVIIDEWIDAGLVIVITTKIGPLLYFTAFHRNQVGFRYDKEPPSRYSLPDEYERTKHGIRHIDGNLTEDCRKTSVSVSEQEEVEVEVEVEEGDRARMTEPEEPRQPLPPHLQNMLDHQNGINVHYRSRNGIIVDAYTEQARKLGVDAPSFSRRIDALAGCIGKRSYIDAAEEDNSTLNSIKAGIITLAKLGHNTEADYRQLCESFAAANQWMDSPVPTLNQLLDHAGKLKDGVLDVKPKPRLPKPGPGGLYDFPTMAAMKAATAANPDIRSRVTVKGTRV